jgi:aminoglycoside phosphotransferase (APT) family kinase protein
MLALTDHSGRHYVLRLMTNEPWRTHGAALTRRESAALVELARTEVPAPTTVGLDAAGSSTDVAAHLMSRLPGVPTARADGPVVRAMATMLSTIHDVRPTEPFRTYQSWAWEAKWQAPPWTRHPDSWQRAFDILADGPPDYDARFLHRDFSHRNLLWTDGAISGVVDWVETSTGPVWLDAGHAATNLAVAFGPEPARSFLAEYAALTADKPDRYWLVMDAVGFLPPPGKLPMFGSPAELHRLDEWLDELVRDSGPAADSLSLV